MVIHNTLIKHRFKTSMSCLLCITNIVNIYSSHCSIIPGGGGGALSIYTGGGLRHGHNPKKGGLRHGHNPKKGVLGTGTSRKKRGGGS